MPQALGGWGLSTTAACTLLERMAAHDFASTFALVVHNNLCASIARNGTTQHIERYLRPMMAGEAIGAFLLTEPQGGSDAAAIETHADKTPAGWQLEGAKAWVSNATVADVLSVYAQTVRGSGAHGIACFLLPAAAAGVTRKAPYALVGGHALNTGGIDLAGCAVDGRRIDDRARRGLQGRHAGDRFRPSDRGGDVLRHAPTGAVGGGGVHHPAARVRAAGIRFSRPCNGCWQMRRRISRRHGC